MNEKLKKYLKDNLEKDKISIFGKFKSFFATSNDESTSYDYEEENTYSSSDTLYKRKSSYDIDIFIEENNNYNDFQTTLFKLIDDRNLKDNEVYNKVHIDRRLFSKIRSDKNYHPSKETVILLGLSLELSELEIDKLLESASYSLPKNNYYDLIIRFCFINKIYKIKDVNNLLMDYNCKLFNY